MKKFFLLLSAAVITMTAMAAPVHVISNQKVAKGYYPRFAKNATEITYLSSEQESYAEVRTSDMYVTNEDLKLVLYKNGTRTELYPHGTDVNYIWSSISPDGTKILFNTRKGTAVCDLNGKELYYLGQNTFPMWYGNDYVIATTEENDGHNYTAGAVVILSLDGQLQQVLTDKSEIAMDPSVSYETGQIVYNDIEGNIHLLQISLSGQPIKQRALPVLRRVEGVQPKAARRIQEATKKNFSDFKIYINPGHGGYDGNDRGMKVQKDEQTVGYFWWESQSNLDKGLKLNEWLIELGFQTKISRTENTSGPGDIEDYYPNATGAKLDSLLAGGDRHLSAIVAEANTYDADFMLSIHSNAGSPSNYVLQLFRGLTPGDERTYSDMPTAENNQKSFEITTLMGEYQWSNGITTWNGRSAPYIAGDKTFGADIMGWSNGYGVLRRLKVPGTISEGAMHDYYPETHRLMNMDYKHLEAWHFRKTFCHYYMDYKQTKGGIAGQVRDSYRKQTFPKMFRVKGSRDEKIPINRAKVELLQNGEVIRTYETDTCYNGVFIFWDLEPGKYSVRVPEGQYELRVPGITEQESYYYAKEIEVEVKADEMTYVDMMIDAQRSTRPEVISYSPAITAENITDSVEVSAVIVLDFNWDMNTEATEAAFSISPAIEGTFTWENSYRRLRFKPLEKFEKCIEYTVTLAKSAAHPDTKWPHTLAEDFILKFRTKNRENITILDTYPIAGQQDVPVNPSFIIISDQPLSAKSDNYKFQVVDSKGVAQTINTRSCKWNKSFLNPNGSIVFELANALAPNADYKLVIEPKLVDNVGVYLNKTVEIPFHTAAEVEGENDCIVVDKCDKLVLRADKESSLYIESASTVRYTSKKVNGTASNQLKFAFADPDSYASYTYSGDSLLYANSQSKFGMYVFGDFSKNELLAIWNAEGDIKYTSLGVIDFAGWKYLNADMAELPVGVRFQFMGLRLKRGDGLLSQEGFICVDDMKLFAPGVSTAIDNIESDQLGVQKVVENDQLIIIKNGARYNVLGTVVE